MGDDESSAGSPFDNSDDEEDDSRPASPLALEGMAGEGSAEAPVEGAGVFGAMEVL